jgi:RNA polymerase sigma-70 factor (ECF subfamily)
MGSKNPKQMAQQQTWTTEANDEVAAAGAVDWEDELRGHQGWLRSVLAARLSGDEVDEVLQETAMAVVAAKSRPQERTKFAPWLYRIAIRQALLYRRRVGRQRKLWQRVAEQLPADHGQASEPLGWLLAAERQQLVQAAIASLPRRDREVLMLKYRQDWSYGELSEHLGISVSSVEARLFRARQRLRKVLSETEGWSVAEG